MDEPPTKAAPKPCCVCGDKGGQHCTKCKSRHYCGKACQLVDWYERGHKAQCKQLAAEYQGRLLASLMPEKLKIKEAPAIVEDVSPAAGFKAAARLPAVWTAKVDADSCKAAARAPAAGAEMTTIIKASTVDVDKPDWRGTCAICLDLLPVDGCRRIFYACCCEKVCTECSKKCSEYDTRCPLCRTPVHSSDAELVRRLQKHADEGNAEAQLALGEGYFYGGVRLQQDFERAFQLWERAAAQGHPGAQDKLGSCYVQGHGVKINLKTAAQWYRRAAEQGYPHAQFNLGGMFYHGTGVAQSYDEAVRWFRLAAAQGDASANLSLGACYANGDGVPEDAHEALRLSKRAAARGNTDAAAAVEKLQARLAAQSGRPT